MISNDTILSFDPGTGTSSTNYIWCYNDSNGTFTMKSTQPTGIKYIQHIKELDADKLNIEDHHLFYTERYYSMYDEWDFCRPGGYGMSGFKSAKNSMCRMAVWGHPKFYRLVMVDTSNRKNIAKIKR